MNLPVGTQLQGGRYRIVRFISSGGFGCTYEAEYASFNKRVAIKEFFMKDCCNRDEHTLEISVATNSKRELVERIKRKFVDEAHVLFDMHHSGIVRVIDTFEENGTAYYVMEYIEGTSLHEMVRERGTLSEQEALGYIRQVCEALRYIHEQNRLHLDIKPGNIMVDGKGQAILIDFGTSKHYDKETGQNTTTLMGAHTPGYAPYEQASQTFTTFSPSTDIYALGATLYKLLTGITPPESGSLMARDRTLVPLPSHISPSTCRAIERAMQPTRTDRPQSVDEFLAILNASVVAEETITETRNRRVSEKTVIEGKPKKEEEVIQAQEDTTPATKPNEDSNSLRGCLVVLIILTLFALVALIVYGVSAGKDADKKEEIIDSYVATDYHNGHGYVDLGLSVKWATCNVGATTPGDYGDYYAWGETAPKSEYSQETSKTYGKEGIADFSGNPDYDVARKHWGGQWRLPTQAEREELKEKCEWERTTQNGNKGYKVTGPNGNSISLPAAGFRYGVSPDNFGSNGSYWSSTPNESGTCLAYSLYFDSGNYYVDWYRRDLGYSVRPVVKL